MILGTAGHIDHGKTALVRALTGVNTDRLPEEQRRGITIDLGFAPLVIDGLGTISVVDVPGHEAFVRAMVAGATGIELALLVVAADEGVMPQTREHLAILDVLGVSRMVVAITKTDLVEGDWLALAREEVEVVLAGFGRSRAEIIPVSALTGDGLASLRGAIRGAFVSAQAPPAADLFRMPVDRAFTVQGTGTVVTGSIWSGAIAVGDRLTVFPAGEEVRVRGIQQHGQPVSQAVGGSRAALALAGIPLARVARGATVVAGEGWAPTRLMRADVRLLPGLAEPGPKTRLRLHIGAADVECRVVLDYRAGSPGSRHLPARLVLRDPVIARAGDRFVLRLASPSTTIGGGTVTDPYAERARRGAGIPYSNNAAARLSALLGGAALRGVEVATLPVRLGIAPRQVATVVGQAGAAHAGGRVYSADAVAALAARVRALVTEFHSREPLKAGIPAQQLRSLVGAAAPLLDLVLGGDSEPRLEVKDGLVAIAGRSTALDPEDLAVLRAALHDICAARLEPRDVAELVASFGDRVPALLRFAERRGELVRVEPDRYYSAAAIAGLAQQLRGAMQPGLTYSPARLREIAGVSRKYLIPLLEYCDRAGITDRRDGGRVLLVHGVVHGVVHGAG